mmetsp:Transcript_25222/g.36144  ORF Transcript_25222/g.36144 Transcript_25222/m.36144 type:complete len:90 (-) Transcript_25222:732-1001(-)
MTRGGKVELLLDADVSSGCEAMGVPVECDTVSPNDSASCNDDRVFTVTTWRIRGKIEVSKIATMAARSEGGRVKFLRAHTDQRAVSGNS